MLTCLILNFVILDFIQANDLDVDYISAHGHTVFHEPENQFTCQIGDGETMAAILERPVITNFRNKDVALHGQGAPLSPGGEQFLFHDYDFCLNLGGIANISELSTKQGYDICACNQVLNHLVSRLNEALEYDKDGKLARQGHFIEELHATLNQLEFFGVAPPKSLGREWVEESILPLLRKVRNIT